MKLFLDDERQAPDGWISCRWPSEVIALLEEKGAEITDLSLDHDLGDAITADREGRIEKTGYTVMLWLEGRVSEDPSTPVPNIHFHTANPEGLRKMKASLSAIRKMKENT